MLPTIHRVKLNPHLTYNEGVIRLARRLKVRLTASIVGGMLGYTGTVFGETAQLPWQLTGIISTGLAINGILITFSLAKKWD